VLRRLVLVVAIILFSVGCDQATKQMAISGLKGEPMISYLGDTVRLLYAENPGAFLGMGGGWGESARGIVFIFGTIVLLSVLTVWMVRGAHPQWVVVSGALLVGGGVGNLVDRIIRDGRVVDFMNVGIGSLRTGIFNVADIWIIGGVIALAVWGWRSPDDKKPSDAASGQGSGGDELVDDGQQV
jgi:signal peptidase II